MVHGWTDLGSLCFSNNTLEALLHMLSNVYVHSRPVTPSLEQSIRSANPWMTPLVMDCLHHNELEGCWDQQLIHCAMRWIVYRTIEEPFSFNEMGHSLIQVCKSGTSPCGIT